MIDYLKVLANNIRIKYKIILFSFVTISIFTLLSMHFLINKSYQYIVEKKTETYNQFVENASKNIYFTLKSYEKILNAFFLNENFRSYVSENYKNIPTQLVFQNWLYNYVDMMTLDYDPLPSLKFYLDNPSIVPDGVLLYSIEEFNTSKWSKMIAEKPERIKIHRWLNTEKKRRNERDFYTLCGLVDIVDDRTNRRVAVVTVEIDAERFFSFLKTKNDITALTNREGYVIYSTERDRITQTVSDRDYFKAMKEKPKGSFTSIIDNKNMLVFYDTIESMDWKIIVMTEMSGFLGETVLVRNYALLLALSGITASMAFTFIYASIITRRILLLTNAMIQVGQGNFDVTVDISGSDEIGKMNGVFSSMLRETKNMINRIKETENSIYRLEIMTLQEKIKPHFLYNTLSAIGSMAAEVEANDIYASLSSLSDFYRISLSDGKYIIPIKNELQHVKAYVQLMRLRFSNKFDCEWSVDRKADSYYTLKLVLQPIVENSILHGFYDSMPAAATIKLRVEKQEDHIVFEIRDNGVGMDDNRIKEIFSGASGSFAIKSIDARIKLLFGNDFGVTIKSIAGKGTTTTIIIPLIDRDMSFSGTDSDTSRSNGGAGL